MAITNTMAGIMQAGSASGARLSVPFALLAPGMTPKCIHRESQSTLFLELAVIIHLQQAGLRRLGLPSGVLRHHASRNQISGTPMDVVVISRLHQADAGITHLAFLG